MHHNKWITDSLPQKIIEEKQCTCIIFGIWLHLYSKAHEYSHFNLKKKMHINMVSVLMTLNLFMRSNSSYSWRNWIVFGRNCSEYIYSTGLLWSVQSGDWCTTPSKCQIVTKTLTSIHSRRSLTYVFSVWMSSAIINLKEGNATETYCQHLFESTMHLGGVSIWYKTLKNKNI